MVVRAYHRPATLHDALELLARDDVTTRVLAGGTDLVGRRCADPYEVVDLQAVGLGDVVVTGDTVDIGAMVRLQKLIDTGVLPAVLTDLVRREAPFTLRNAATLGGTVAAADPESELVAGLLVHEAEVTLVSAEGEQTLALAELLTEGSSLSGAIITSVRMATGGIAAAARTGRTPADRPIVMAVARRNPTGRVLLALTGVGPVPRLVDPEEASALRPPADFRGSADYRGELAVVLAERVTAGLE